VGKWLRLAPAIHHGDTEDTEKKRQGLINTAEVNRQDVKDAKNDHMRMGKARRE
jgi:hypothetical protein